jgi:putative chitinase
MTQVTAAQIVAMLPPAARPKEGTPMRSRQDNIIQNLVNSLNQYGKSFDLDVAVNLARFIGQCAIETDYFRTLKEYASGAAYEGRSDLGNTQQGDGIRFAGKGVIQTTGRANYKSFNEWARLTLPGIIGKPVPDFVKDPDQLLVFPYAFFSAAYFWHKGNRTGKSLNLVCAQNNDELLTRIINGGLTHFDRRLEMTTAAALTILGFKPNDVKAFQQYAEIVPDGIVGRKTRDEIQIELRVHEIPEAIKPIILSQAENGDPKIREASKFDKPVPPPENFKQSLVSLLFKLLGWKK